MILAVRFLRSPGSTFVRIARNFQLTLALAQTLRQLLFQNCEFGDFMAYRRNLCSQQISHVRTGLSIVAAENQQFTDFRERKP